MAYRDESIVNKHLTNDPELKSSYGDLVPQPDLPKGAMNAIGELAGSTTKAPSLAPKRISFEDSIHDQKSNLGKSH